MWRDRAQRRWVSGGSVDQIRNGCGSEGIRLQPVLRIRRCATEGGSTSPSASMAGASWFHADWSRMAAMELKLITGIDDAE